MDYLGYAISAASGGGGGGSSFDPLLIDSDLVPTDTATYDVGRPLKRWRNGEFTAVNSVSVIAPTVTVATIASNNPTVDVTSLNGVTANKFTVNGGTDQQYLMGDGSLLKYSANSGNSNFYLYNSSQVITAPPPSGFIRYNNIVQDNATEIYISHLTRDNIDIDVFFNQITIITEVYIQDQNSSTDFIQYNVVATPSITPNSYVTLSVSKRSSNGTGSSQFPNGHNILLSFFTNGIEVDGRLTALEGKTNNIVSSSGVTTTITGNWVPSGTVNVGTSTTPVSGVFATTVRSAQFDAYSGGQLVSIATSNSGGVTLGRVGAATNILGSSIVTTGNITPATTNTGSIGTAALTYNNGFFTTLNTNTLDTATAVAQNIGILTQTTLTIGRVGAATNLRGSSIVTTGNITPATTNVGTIGTAALTYNNGFFTVLSTPSIDTATAVAQNIGTVTQTALTLGRVGATTNLRGLTIVTTGNITPATTNVGTIGTSALTYNNVFTNQITTAGTTPLITLGTGTTITGNWVPSTVSSGNLGSATNRWNVFAQTLTLPNTAGVRVTNFNSTSSNTVANTTTATSLLGTGTGSLSLTDVSDTSRHVYCSGTLSCLAAATLTIRFSSSSGTTFLNTYTLLVSSSVPFVFELDYTNKTSTYYGIGRFQYGANTPILFQYMTGFTLGTNTYDLTVQWGSASASNTITAVIGTVETLA